MNVHTIGDIQPPKSVMYVDKPAHAEIR